MSTLYIDDEKIKENRNLTQSQLREVIYWLFKIRGVIFKIKSLSWTANDWDIVQKSLIFLVHF